MSNVNCYLLLWDQGHDRRTDNPPLRPSILKHAHQPPSPWYHGICTFELSSRLLMTPHGLARTTPCIAMSEWKLTKLAMAAAAAMSGLPLPSRGETRGKAEPLTATPFRFLLTATLCSPLTVDCRFAKGSAVLLGELPRISLFLVEDPDLILVDGGSGSGRPTAGVCIEL